MIKHIWSVLCREALIDSETNNVSLLNIFERLEINISLPKDITIPVDVPITYELVSLWVKDNLTKEEELDINISIISPENEVVNQLSKKMVIPVDKARMRSRIKITGLKITKSGNYLFQIAVKEMNSKKFTTEAELPLEVVIHEDVKKSKTTN